MNPKEFVHNAAYLDLPEGWKGWKEKPAHYWTGDVISNLKSIFNRFLCDKSFRIYAAEAMNEVVRIRHLTRLNNDDVPLLLLKKQVPY